jgi:tetratricopeptide (TPR) repeat protein
MRGFAAVLMGAAVLAGCAEPDLLAGARATCGNPSSEAEAKISACTELIEADTLDDKTRSIALANRGGAYDEAGDVTAALRDFDAALEADGENMRAVRGRAAILIASGQLDAAEPLADRLIASGELADIAHYLKGDILAQSGDLAGALASYDAAIAENARFEQALAARARLKQRQNDQEGALADYDAALAINPQLSPALAGRCWARVLSKDSDANQARADAEAAVEIDPRDTRAHLCLGLLLLRTREWDAARQSYDAVLTLEPGNPTALFGRGVARRRGGDIAGREDMNLARDFNRHVGEEFDELGVETF